MSPSSGRTPNRLIHETSPYLLQHAYNPVDWYPWGADALQAARSQHKPILLSIGYSACHWCHVMERESFENETIAAVMNRHFICIKVDREERPDLDEIYMAATVAMNHGQGGWPMTVFLTPDQQPFFAGTYFPPQDRWGRPGFGTLLEKIAEYWAKDTSGVHAQAQAMTERLKGDGRLPSPISISESVLDDAVAQFTAEFDSAHGGFGGAPKFPPAAGLSLLLRCHRRSNDPHTLTMVTTTLDRMAAGGLYDQIGGGFARYSTDERWLVPHFEKMLYDNALLARVYVEAYQVTKNADYRRVATDVLDYVLREMTGDSGSFYSATDADSEGEEGKFFVWTPSEVRAALGDPELARRVCAVYDITEQGNWEHKNIPNRLRPLEAIAQELNLTVDALLESVRLAKPLLYRARAQRVPPGLDDKIITAWNGMMISAMAEAARVFGEPRFRVAAQRAADFLLRVHVRPDGRLLRTSRAGRAHLDAYLEDYAYLAEGLIDLYEAGAAESYLHTAAALAMRLIEDFLDAEHGGFFTTANSHETLILRGREGSDGATPGGNAVAASALARLAAHFDRADWRDVAVSALRAYGRQMTRFPRAFAKSLAVVDFLTQGPVELAFVGSESQDTFRNLQRAVAEQFIPNRIIATARSGESSTLPLLQGKLDSSGVAALYVCRQFACQRPVTDPRDVVGVLGGAVASHGDRHDDLLLSGSRLSGFATTTGTAGYAAHILARSPALAYGYGVLGSTGLTASRLGFGTYRVAPSGRDHREALEYALRNGCNLIDTSTNYMDGDSERLVGSVLAAMTNAGDVQREQVVVVSKIGYVQGQNLKMAESREKTGRPYPDMVKYRDGVWHCIHPEFLADQLALSLDRLGLDTLDVCLLHNPEYFFSDAVQRGAPDLSGLRTAFYDRVMRAFVYFESQVAAGRLRYYGVSSNTLAGAADAPDSVSVTRILAAADAAAYSIGQRGHHLAFLQCPMNLFESGAFSTANTGKDGHRTVLECAREAGLAVLVNRPLNAMPPGCQGMVRLADVPLENGPVDFATQCAKVDGLEREYRQSIAPAIQHGGQGMAPAEFFNWAEELRRIRPQIQGVEHWEQIEQHMIAPHVNQVLQAVSRHLSGSMAEQWETWRDRYVPELLLLLRGLQREAAERSRHRAAAISERVNPLLPVPRRSESLSRRALWVLASTPGISCVLNGMRTVSYAQDSLAVLSWEPAKEVSAVYGQMASGAFD